MKRHVTAAIDDAMGRALCRETRSRIAGTAAAIVDVLFEEA